MPDVSSLLLFYLPLGIVGAWRWGTWLVKKIISWFYRADTREYHAAVSLVIPVYNEDPAIFRAALASWQANNPSEIIAVIDHTDRASQQEFEAFRRGFPGARMIVTEKPGKRPALADGIRAASGEIVALVDSDVIWEKDTLREALRPFADAEVAGVGTRQNVLEPQTLPQHIFDIQLDLRFHDDMLPSAVAGSVFTCLSGRTALYRRKVVLPLLDDLVKETFWGKQCIGGDDKRLTYLVEAAGGKCRYQHSARVYTHAAEKMATLIKQRTRWSRNSWRADLRALNQGWVFRHPFFTFILLDRIISNFTLLLSPIYFIFSLVFGLWLPAAAIFLWWLFSRSLRIMPNLVRHPKNIRLAPVYVWVNFVMAVIRIYGLLTLNRQDWITRTTDKKPGNAGLFLAWVGTFGILALMSLAVYASRF